MRDIIARRTDLETGRWVEIIRDFDFPVHPLRDEEWDGILTLTPRYSAYGNDSDNDPRKEEFQKYLRAVRIYGGVSIPIYCLEHGGITFSAGSFADPWDSGIAGFAWMPPAKVKENFKGDKKAAIAYLKQMISVMDAYAQGECYGYALYDTDGSEVWQTSGFWNIDGRWDELMTEMADSVPEDFAPLIKNCWYGELDELVEIPSRFYVPGFAPAV